MKLGLELQNECPKCKVSWEAITEMLREPMGTDNFLIAWRIINSCDTCGQRFLSVIDDIREAQKTRLKKEWGNDTK